MSNAINAPETPTPRGRRKSTPAPVAPTIWEQWQFVVIAAGVLVLCTTFIAGTFYVLRQVQAARREMESARNQQGSATISAGSSSATTVDSNSTQGQSPYQAASEESLANRALILRIQQKITEAQESLESIRKLRGVTYDTILELYDSENGKRIASNKENTRTFMALVDMGPPSPSVIDSMQARLDGFAKPNGAAIGGDSYSRLVPGADIGIEFDLLLNEIREMEYQLASRQDSFVKLKYVAANDSAAEQTLSTVVGVLRQQDSAQRFSELRAVQEAAKQKADEMVLAAEKEAIIASGKAEAEARRILGESEAAALIEDAKLRQEKLTAEINQKRESQRDSELRARAADSVIQQKYTPFLDKGKVLFDQGDGYYSGSSERGLPVSWQNLNNSKWLDSVERFAKAMSNPFKEIKNDRRIKAYPRSEAEWKEMERMYEEFKQLGPIWVEMGLLSP